ncbi:chemotaxis protein CheW [bacterium]|nr:chemotaxis protein CheW [bacterium]
MTSLSVLVVSVEARAFALRLDEVSEIMRPLSVAPMPGAPPFVRGVAVARGEPRPVVDLAMLLGASEPVAPERFVAVKTGERQVLLAVETVVGIQRLSAAVFEDLPPLFRQAKGHAMEAIASLDDRLLILLAGGRLVPPEHLAVLTPEESE